LLLITAFLLCLSRTPHAHTLTQKSTQSLRTRSTHTLTRLARTHIHSLRGMNVFSQHERVLTVHAFSAQSSLQAEALHQSAWPYSIHKGGYEFDRKYS
jgi:hypothetical protein